jgi:hypothetical protein
MRKPMSDVSSVLNRVLSKLGLDKRLREHTFLSLWPTFVPSQIADRSRPLFIDNERNLVISVADAATGQELSLMKSRIMTKLGPAARSLGIDIRGIRPDLKHYHAQSTMVYHPLASEERLPAHTEEELAQVKLSEEEQAQIDELAARLALEGTKADAAAGMVRLFEREFRLRRWRLAHKYPTCDQCGNPVERLHPMKGTTDRVCIACLYRDS